MNTDSLNLLGEGQAKQDLRVIEGVLGGNARFQLNITKTTGESFLNTKDLNRLNDFQEAINQNPLLATPISLVNFRRFLEDRLPPRIGLRAPRIPNLLRNSATNANPFFALYSSDFTQVNIAVNVKELETQALEKLLAQIKNDFDAHFPPDQYRLEVFSFLALFAQLNQFILQTQFRSFGVAFLIAFGILFFFIGRFSTSILALLPNLLPLSFTILIMLLFHIDMDTSSAMLAPIMLGVAMDDTIHLMNKYKLYRLAGQSVEESMNKALEYTGGALFSTTIALVCGFLVVGWSGVVSVSTFGLLCAFTIVAALLADVVFLPALVKRFDQ